jgi:uncharacterized protein (DUF697 family)
MNHSVFLHVVERLEGLVGKLPARIQKAILNELTPLKELFLKQRSPRFVFTGSATTPLPQLMSAMFPGFSPEVGSRTHRKEHWRDYRQDRGTISILDARDQDSNVRIADELKSLPADVIFFVEDEDRKKMRKEPLENLVSVSDENRRGGAAAGVIGVIYGVSEATASADLADRGSRLHSALESKLTNDTPVLRIVAVSEGPGTETASAVISAITQNLPNDARIETARVFGHRPTQTVIAQLLVKSTTAICTAIGAQPIPLADLPILTTLQLVMVSGIMYVSGRERSLRAATEFIAALGANVGAGMLLREGARALLKLVPGFGNIVCGMVAGAGTYAIGRAAIAYFLEGVSIRDARRTYLTSRKRSRKHLELDNGQRESLPTSDSARRSKRLRLRR